jgi:hypothetical protein
MPSTFLHLRLTASEEKTTASLVGTASTFYTVFQTKFSSPWKTHSSGETQWDSHLSSYFSVNSNCWPLVEGRVWKNLPREISKAFSTFLECLFQVVELINFLFLGPKSDFWEQMLIVFGPWHHSTPGRPGHCH